MMQELTNSAVVKPFVKWAGGKTQILNEIRALYPAELGRYICKYAEPFVGGGAVLFDILNNYRLNEVYISDINKELICTYLAIRDDMARLIEILEVFEQQYLAQCSEGRREIYYEKRKRFNELKGRGDNNTELAGLFIFLNHTCYNGLYRVNAKGEFNVPHGRYKKPGICAALNIKAVSDKLKGVTIVCGDYRLANDFIDDTTFVYFDPPYRPLSATSSFTAYAKGGFGDLAQTQLADFIDKTNKRGAYILASNSDPKNTDTNDNFFDNLYAKYTITRIDADRSINSKGGGRGKVKELLIATYKVKTT